MNPENLNYKVILKQLETDEINGISNEVAKEHLSFYGKNKLREQKKTPIIIKFFMQFNDFMIIILLMAAFVSFFISYLKGEPDFIDPLIILIIITVNAVLGLVQESKAEKSLEALKKMSAPMAKVIRSGKQISISTEDLVPGDIILIETGDYVPADARLIESYNLMAEESSLTGESLPVEKDADLILNDKVPIGDRRNMIFASTIITAGRGRAVVCFTGMDTEVGRIAHMIISDDAPDTPLQKKLEHTGKILGFAALGICGIIFVLGILRQVEPFLMFMTSVSLAVAAIPEGLPAIVTIMLAIGVQRMAKENAIIRKLPAVETLGSASVICSDKTGTLTQNKMKVVEIANSTGKLKTSSVASEYILTLGSLCCNIGFAKNGDIIGDPTEKAIVLAAISSGITKDKLDKDYKRISEIPFDSKRKLMTTINKTSNNEHLIITKGAPDVLIERCTHFYENGKKHELTKLKKHEILKTNSEMAKKALRVLAISFKNMDTKPSEIGSGTLEKDLTFVGFLGLIDPPRPEVLEAVATCKKAGIKPVMVTGDHIITAMAIGAKIGILSENDKAITGAELSNLTQEELNEVIFDYSVFARLSPEHKVRIVKAFQSKGAVVAMTGDGVNDAPALKSADIGCAMGITGTDVAKGAADMILADDNFSTIVTAVKEGRGIYQNIRKAIHFLLSSNVGEIISILSAIVMGFQTPLLAIHLLWVNLVTDSLPAIALGVDPIKADIMEQKPFNTQKSLFSDGLWFKIILEGCMIGLLTLIAFGIGITYFDKPNEVIIGRTMAFTTLSISQLVHTFNMRSEKSIFSSNPFDNIYLVFAVIICAIAQLAVITIKPLIVLFKVTSLPMPAYLIVFGLCLVPILVVEIEKLFRREKSIKTRPVYR